MVGPRSFSIERVSFSFPLIILVLLTETVLAISIIFLAQGLMTIIAFIIVALLALMFYKQTIVIDDTIVQLTYGMGFLRTTIDIHEIDKVEVISNVSPRSWIYNPSLSHALKIRTRNGATLVIAHEDPNRLGQVLNAKLR